MLRLLFINNWVFMLIFKMKTHCLLVALVFLLTCLAFSVNELEHHGHVFHGPVPTNLALYIREFLLIPSIYWAEFKTS